MYAYITNDRLDIAKTVESEQCVPYTYIQTQFV